MVSLKRKPKARECTDHRIISPIAHAAKVVASVIRRRSEKKLRTYLGKISLDLEKEKELEM
jgi:hypothetical protein